MMSALTIFLLVGAAHWAAHIIQCPACKGTFFSNGTFLLEGAIEVFGWPVRLPEYGREWSQGAPVGPARADIESRVKQSVDDFFKRHETQILEVRQNPGETDEAFEARIQSMLSDHVKKQRAAKGQSNETSNASRS